MENIERKIFEMQQEFRRECLRYDLEKLNAEGGYNPPIEMPIDPRETYDSLECTDCERQFTQAKRPRRWDPAKNPEPGSNKWVDRVFNQGICDCGGTNLSERELRRAEFCQTFRHSFSPSLLTTDHYGVVKKTTMCEVCSVIESSLDF